MFKKLRTCKYCGDVIPFLRWLNGELDPHERLCKIYYEAKQRIPSPYELLRSKKTKQVKKVVHAEED